MILLLTPASVRSAETGILVLSDSHGVFVNGTTRFGDVLTVGLSTLGPPVYYHAACGFGVRHYLSRNESGRRTSCGYSKKTPSEMRTVIKATVPNFQQLFNPREHSLVIIHLGDNLLGWRNQDGLRYATSGGITPKVQAMMAAIPDGTKCIWIGPTYHIRGTYYLKRDSVVDSFYNELNAAVGNKCKVVDSRPLVVTRTPNDGLHHINSDSKAWGTKALQKVLETLRDWN